MTPSFRFLSRPILAALLLAGAALAAQDKDKPKFDGDIQKYWTDACSRCHGANGSGRDASGRQLPDAGFDFTDSRKANKKKDAEWLKSILDGKDKMPAYKGLLTEADASRMITEILRKFAARR
ncbi:MAG: cytochrome c [Holophagaceae bacterium]|nr:cytochrome c [Holophagaceae bacterium]